ncbi:hypothetical protein [Streptomyces griseocarneus]|uniref:Uncharacterized protein n=1 Tax=Streptomyces griseocarneus TaxID=51201 RepID=A0ABX7RY73_9ACTN|nr:hypothetical protein [Streptomyces griseocarneus]QSY51939.1 hypothetical protein J3S04_14550 [Streptomyces griseocarneus]
MTSVSADVSFVALPDSAAGSAAAAAVPAPGPRVINHASGRPWLMGRWPADAVKVATAGRTRVVVAGFCPLATAELAACATRLTGGVAGLDDLARRLGGSAHLMASVGGRVRVQGGVAGVRSVYRARIAGVSVAADRPDALAGTTGPSIDERLVGLRLLTPFVPHPLRERTPWCGVEAVPPGSYLTIDPDGTARTVRWWTPPPPELGLEEGAPAVRDALTEAVGTRLRALGGDESGAAAIGVALPGSMESAVLAHLAASGDHRLITVRTARLDPGGDDAPWARRIAARLPRAEHVVLEYAHAPALYAGLDQGAGVLPAEPRTGSGRAPASSTPRARSPPGARGCTWAPTAGRSCSRPRPLPPHPRPLPPPGRPPPHPGPKSPDPLAAGRHLAGPSPTPGASRPGSPTARCV